VHSTFLTFLEILPRRVKIKIRGFLLQWLNFPESETRHGTHAISFFLHGERLSVREDRNV